MKRVLQNERGIALAIAIFALVVVGALVAGAFFAGTQEQRMGENQRRAIQSFGIAEGGAYEVVRGWNPDSINTRGVYPSDSFFVRRVTTSGGTGSFGGWVYKLNRNLYLIDVTGADSASLTGRLVGGGGRQRVGVLVRIRPLQVDVKASLTTKGAVRLAGNAMVDGNIHIPPNWTNCDTLPDTSKAGIRTPDPASVQGEETHSRGTPQMLADPTVADSTFDKFGEVYYADLARRANIKFVGDQNIQTVQPSLIGTACNKSDQYNWGDGVNKTAPCGQYFPIIHVAGNLTVNTRQGQGILLVDGDLRIQGLFEFFGIVVVKGSLTSAGGAEPHFWGGVLAKNVDVETQLISGNAILNYSKCAVVQALQHNGMTALTRSRGWVQLF